MKRQTSNRRQKKVANTKTQDQRGSFTHFFYENKQLIGWIGLCAVYALCLNLGRVHAADNGDTVIPSLLSILGWKPFYWHNNRYGMLVPLLAIPIRNPLWNYFFIYYLNIVGALAGFFLLARFLFGRVSWWPLVAGVAIAVTILAGSADYLFFLFSPSQFWSTPLAMLLGALLLVEEPTPQRFAVAAVLALLAGWYNLAVPVYCGILYVARGLAAWDFPPGGLKPFIKRHAPAGALLAASGGLGMGLCNIMAVKDQPITRMVDTPEQWWQTMKAVWSSCWQHFGSEFGGRPYIIYVIFGMMAITPVVLLWRPTNTTYGPLWRLGLAGVVSAVGSAAATVLSQWVRINNSDFRFFHQSWFIALIAVVGMLIGPVLANANMQTIRRLAICNSGIAFLVCFIHLGLPSLERALAGWFDQARAMAGGMVDANCTHIAGTYWHVWPTVLEANRVLYESGKSRKMFGLAGRYDGTWEQWPTNPAEWVIGVPKGEEHAMNALLNEIHIREIVFVADYGKFSVFKPKG